MKKTNQSNQSTKQKKTPVLVAHSAFIPLFCYTVALLCWLLVCTFGLVADTLYIAKGSLAAATLTPQQFELVDFEVQPDGSLTALSADPQMILTQLPKVVRTLRLSAEYSSNPHEINLYYITKPGQAFGKTMRVWPVPQPDGSLLFTLPRTHIEALRLDPASAEVNIKLHSLQLNGPRSSLGYFNPGWGGLVLLLVLPAFGAAVLRWVLNVIQYRRKQ